MQTEPGPCHYYYKKGRRRTHSAPVTRPKSGSPTTLRHPFNSSARRFDKRAQLFFLGNRVSAITSNLMVTLHSDSLREPADSHALCLTLAKVPQPFYPFPLPLSSSIFTSLAHPLLCVRFFPLSFPPSLSSPPTSSLLPSHPPLPLPASPPPPSEPGWHRAIRRHSVEQLSALSSRCERVHLQDPSPAPQGGCPEGEATERETAPQEGDVQQETVRAASAGGPLLTI